LIIERLIATNKEQSGVYSRDQYCAAAREKIYAAIAGGNPAPWREGPRPDIHFLVGGTQTNTVVIASALKPFQGVICAESGHINVHETGAVESTGHKIISIPSDTGKITAAQISEVYDAHYFCSSPEHCVQPAMVYISQPTETGTVYSLSELTEMSDTCRELGLLLFVDGARLACSLACEGTPTLSDLARLTDVFYIGGTKHGALFGEAVVIMNEEIKKDFRYIIKQRGGMFAKGRMLGLQFGALFTDNLYYRVGKKEVRLAASLRKGFEDKGIELYYNSPTNQLFPILSDEQLEKLSEKYSFSIQKKLTDGRTLTRFCTSWASTDEQIDGLIADIKELPI